MFLSVNKLPFEDTQALCVFKNLTFLSKYIFDCVACLYSDIFKGSYCNFSKFIKEEKNLSWVNLGMFDKILKLNSFF